GGPATAAQLDNPVDFAVGVDGSLFISQLGMCRVRRVAPDGIITTVAGTSSCGFSGDAGPATGAQLNNPTGIAVGPDGSLYIADQYNRRVRRVGVDGIISTIAGTGVYGHTGDGGLATSARLAQPNDVVVRPDGVIYIADGAYTAWIRRVDP